MFAQPRRRSLVSVALFAAASTSVLGGVGLAARSNAATAPLCGSLFDDFSYASPATPTGFGLR